MVPPLLVARVLMWTLTLGVLALYVVNTRQTSPPLEAKIERYCRYLVATERQVRNCSVNITGDFLGRARNQAAYYATGMDPRCFSDAGPLCRD